MTIKIERSKKKKPEYSKKLVSDIRWLLWMVTIGGIVLATASRDVRKKDS